MKSPKHLPKVLIRKSFTKRIYSYWQFWMLVMLLAVGTFFLDTYLIMWGNDAPYRIKAVEQQEFQKAYVDYHKAALAALKADTYGGSTPEETLEMFITALENEDYDLASKYVVIEEREKFVEQMSNLIAIGNMERLEKIVHNYRINVVEINRLSNTSYDINIKQAQRVVGFNLSARLNTQSKIWKLSDI